MISPPPLLRAGDLVPPLSATPYQHLGAFVRIATPRVSLLDGPASDQRLAQLGRHTSLCGSVEFLALLRQLVIWFRSALLS